MINDQRQLKDPTNVPSSPDRRRPSATRATHRQLVDRGLSASEAANLTAYLNRLPAGDQPWSLTQLNTLLFLRSLCLAGRFGPMDGTLGSSG
jgi:hypothetical protein